MGKAWGRWGRSRSDGCAIHRDLGRRLASGADAGAPPHAPPRQPPPSTALDFVRSLRKGASKTICLRKARRSGVFAVTGGEQPKS